jgi:hypothetical protein
MIIDLGIGFHNSLRYFLRILVKRLTGKGVDYLQPISRPFLFPLQYEKQSPQIPLRILYDTGSIFLCNRFEKSCYNVVDLLWNRRL